MTTCFPAAPPTDGSSSTNLNAYGTAGINTGAWHLRSDYQFNQTDSDDNHEQSGEILAYLSFSPVTAIRYKINLRRNGLRPIFSTVFIPARRWQVTIECAMGTTRLRPQISGCTTNATVTMSQSGRVICRKSSHQAHLSLTTLISLFRAHWMSK
ncbi:fimbria/pilus outer membrane usher protein [Escherichia coli]